MTGVGIGEIQPKLIPSRSSSGGARFRIGHNTRRVDAVGLSAMMKAKLRLQNSTSRQPGQKRLELLAQEPLAAHAEMIRVAKGKTIIAQKKISVDVDDLIEGQITEVRWVVGGDGCEILVQRLEML
jgi:hypothetical protein